MAESEVPIVSRLRLDRESWASDLQGAKSQMTEFVQGLSAQRLTIPLAVDLTEVTARIQAFRVEQESRPIRIPVEMVPAGGGGGAASLLQQPVTAEAAQAAQLRSQYAGYLVAARTAQVSDVEMIAAANAERSAGMAAGTTGAAAGAAASGGGMRGFRGMMLLTLGMHGAEGAIGAVGDRLAYDRMDATRGDPLENERKTIQMMKQEKQFFFGLPSAIRDAGEWASGNKTSGRMIEDMENDLKTQERHKSFDERIRERDRSVNEQADIEGMPEGFTRKLAEIEKHTKDLKEGFRKEATELNELAAATKDAAQAQELHREARQVVERGDKLADRIGTAETARARLLEGRDVAALDARTEAQQFTNARMPRMAQFTEFQSHLQQELDSAEGDPAKQAAIRRLGAAQIQGILNPPLHPTQTSARAIYMDAVKAALTGGTNDYQQFRRQFTNLRATLQAGQNPGEPGHLLGHDGGSALPGGMVGHAETHAALAGGMVPHDRAYFARQAGHDRDLIDSMDADNLGSYGTRAMQGFYQRHQAKYASDHELAVYGTHEKARVMREMTNDINGTNRRLSRERGEALASYDMAERDLMNVPAGSERERLIGLNRASRDAAARQFDAYAAKQRQESEARTARQFHYAEPRIAAEQARLDGHGGGTGWHSHSLLAEARQWEASGHSASVLDNVRRQHAAAAQAIADANARNGGNGPAAGAAKGAAAGASGADSGFKEAVKDFKDAADAIKNAQPLYVAGGP